MTYLNNLFQQDDSDMDKREQVLLKWQDAYKRITDECDMLESLLEQVHENLSQLQSTDVSSDTELQSSLSQIPSIMDSLGALSPKVEDLQNDFSYVARQVHVKSRGEIAQRVIKVRADWESAVTNCRLLKEQLDSVLNMNVFMAAFEKAHGAIIKLSNKTEAFEDDYDPDDRVRILEQIQEECARTNDLEQAMNDAAMIAKTGDGTAMKVDKKLQTYAAAKSALESRINHLRNECMKKQKLQSDVNSSVQVNTLEGEVSRSVQVSTLPLSNADMAEERIPMRRQSIPLTRADIYLQELNTAISESKSSLEDLDSLLKIPDPATVTYDSLVNILGTTQSSVDHMSHLHRLLTEGQNVSSDLARSEEVDHLEKKLRYYEQEARDFGQRLRESSPSKRGLDCPVCSPKQRGAWDSSLWRLEQWLSWAQNTLKTRMKNRPPNDLEQLERAIEEQKEFCLDLHSHRNIVVALSNVLTHLKGHGETATMGSVEVEQMTGKLCTALESWKTVCHNAAAWQVRLQMALMQHADFYNTIDSYEFLVRSVQDNIQALEPVDSGAPKKQLKSNLRDFITMHDTLMNLEPNLRALQGSVQQLLVDEKALENEGTCRPSLEASSQSSDISRALGRLSTCNHQLKSLQRVCEAYMKFLAPLINQDEDSMTSSQMLSFSEAILEQSDSSSHAVAPSAPGTDNDRNDGASVLIRSGRLICRVVRASLPIQAMIIVLLGLSSLFPYTEQDFSCVTTNTFARSIEPMLHYPEGPPPI